MFFKREDFGFNKEEMEILLKLNTPKKIQDFLNNEIEMNFEENGETCMSPRRVLRERKGHCMEGAMLAAAILRIHGEKPLVLDLEATKDDEDHVITVFKKNGKWGAIGKTNHYVLRYREPVYRDMRELVMTFFHEYFLNKNGKKTLRRYSNPIDLSRFDKYNWMTSEEDVWFVPQYLADCKHNEILTKKQIRELRLVDNIEIEAGKIVDKKDPKYDYKSLNEKQEPLNH